ncbi:unknown [Clostridium sp. CAG:1024]|nr:unknown [Clostridium sp. CAG:1024]
MPHSPAALTAGAIFSGSTVSTSPTGVSSVHSFRISLSIAMQSSGFPRSCCRSSTADTVPDTLACTGMPSPPTGSAMICPSLTVSPFCTQGAEGAPMCIPTGITTCPGCTGRTAAPSVGRLPSWIWLSGCTPPLNVCFKMLFSSCPVVGTLPFAVRWFPARQQCLFGCELRLASSGSTPETNVRQDSQNRTLFCFAPRKRRRFSRRRRIGYLQLYDKRNGNTSEIKSVLFYR